MSGDDELGRTATAPESPPAHVAPPLSLGKYRLERELGAGGMGVVHAAFDPDLERYVAIKLLHAEAGRDSSARLLREARAMARLSHPNVVTVHDVDTIDGRDLVAMELIDGTNLAEWLRAEPRLPGEILDAFLAAGAGLVAAHDAGLVHRDFKPHNVLRSRSGRVVVTDFGLARGPDAPAVTARLGKIVKTTPELPHITATGVFVGTPAYMAPEQWRGELVGPAADQFAFCVALWEAFAGERPFKGRTAEELRAEIERDRSTLDASKVPLLYRPALLRGLERDPARRFATMQDLLDAIATARATPPARAARRRPRWVIPAVACMVVAGIAIGLIYFEARHPTAEPATLVVSLEARADEPWVALAAEHLARRALRDAPDRRFWIVPPRDPRANRPIALVARRTADGTHLDARDGDGDATLASSDGASIYEAVTRLAGPLAIALAADRANPGADPDEQAEAKRTGSGSADVYRRFRTLVEDARIPTWLDSTAITPGHEALLRDDPAWFHPYAELEWLYGPEQSAAIVAVARAKGDRARDPVGFGALESLEAAKRGDTAASLAAIEPLYDKANPDPLVIEPYSTALGALERGNENQAMYAQLAERYPDEFFTGNIAAHLGREGRDEEAEQLIRASVAAHPENAVSARELVRLEARAGRAGAAREAAQHMLAIHGERPLVLAETYEALVLSEDLAAARRIVNRMLLGSDLTRARGNYRSAVLAVFEGRFGAAVPLLERAVEQYARFGPQDRETPQSLLLASQLLAAAGNHPAAITKLDALARLEGAHDDPATNIDTRDEHVALAHFRALLLGADRTCPPIPDSDPFRVAKLRLASATACATCADVIAGGFLPAEADPEALVALGKCALAKHELALARRSLERATQLWMTWTNHDASPYFAVLAHYELARVLAAQGDATGARTEYQRFVRYWGNADHTMPEVADAQQQLAKP